MIIDAHTHVWPDKIAQIALGGNRVEGLEARGDGTVSGLTEDMAASGVQVSCCLAIANEARHVDSVNRFVAGLADDTHVPFGTVHVELSVEENLDSLQRHGVRAVKIHPLFQKYALDDSRLWEIFEAFGNDYAVITHVGEGGDAFTNSLSNPGMIRDITRQFPGLRLMACHFGGYKILDDAEEMLAGTDVVLETSWPPSLATLRPERVRDLIRKHGAERIVFGSDWPMTSPAEEIRAIEALGLTDDEVKMVLGGTLASVLGDRLPG
ncbi:amidohydrolase family protein [Nocardioides deserti]|uniref:Amidohydrolase family protein n=1 Tax=Nocardioides deserti TaxID=1588644 RepID=A0ABR6U851_9ACTN|nr:amidohydrolase family protein [Nocardioides deserti]MBC2960026.1 amidohydrolase family protein [Nocardioides deserti]GGO75153.1 amidohydrolase [Nocardioides deserti]